LIAVIANSADIAQTQANCAVGFQWSTKYLLKELLQYIRKGGGCHYTLLSSASPSTSTQISTRNQAELCPLEDWSSLTVPDNLEQSTEKRSNQYYDSTNYDLITFRPPRKS